MRKISRIQISCFAVALFVTLISMPVYSSQLDDFKWKNRVLLLFAPDHRDPELVRTRRTIEQQSCGLKDRDIIVGVFVERGRSTMGNQHLSALDASAVRQRLGGEEGQFVTLLIGKDGHEKYRTEQSPDLETVFALIDGMPMRRKEMGTKHTNCGQPQQ